MGVFTREMARSLYALHPDIKLFTPASVEGLPPDILFRVPQAVRGSTKLKNNVLRAIYLNSLLPLHIMREKADVLYCPMLEYPFFSGVPLIVTVHDLHPLLFPDQFGLSAPYFKVSLNWLHKVARRVTVVSGYVKQMLLAASGLPVEKVDVIHNGYDKKIFRPQGLSGKRDFLQRHSIEEPYILFVGNLFPYKNVNILIDAFLSIKERINHRLVIVGRKEFSGLPLPFHERISYLGYIQQEDLPKIYSYADLLVHPSLSEGFGFTLLEAMACGTPVLASNRASLPEIVGDAGLLFDPTDCVALSSLLLCVLSRKALREEMSEKGLRRATRFSWEEAAAGLLASCERALTA